MSRYGDGPQVRQGNAGLSQGLINDRQDAFDVSPRRDFGNNSSEPLVQFVLSRDDTGEDSPLVVDHGGRRLITGGLDGQQQAARVC